MSTPSTRVQDDPLLGQQVRGCEILDLIGKGGMGNLYRARQLSLDRIVAVKILSPAMSSNKEFLGRFRREARSLANLLHPNIVAIHDFGQEGEICAIVMECVEGESVADMLTRTAILPIPFALSIVRQVAEGLDCAHRAGIIHCDLKPENILVTPEGVAKVIDFGLAKSFRGEGMRVTTDGSILGTPTYMSPEQCEGVPLDARTDIYSLGATLYRMVAGRDAFDGQNAFAIMLKHKNEPPEDPRRLNPSLPAAVARVIIRMMAKRGEQRFQTAGELVPILSALEKGESPKGETAEDVLDPRRDMAFVCEAIEADLLSGPQVDACLEAQDEAARAREKQGLTTLALKKRLLTEEQVRELVDRCQARENARRDQQFARLALEAGLATSAQVAHCLRRQQPRQGVRSPVKLSRIMVDEGVLEQRQVVQLLLRQLKDARRHEDGEFLELIRRKGVLAEGDIEACVREQQRQEAQGHHKVLRQIVLELGLLPAAELNALLREKLRAEVARFVAEHEHAQRASAERILPDEDVLKLDETDRCAACGRPVTLTARACPACGRDVAQARREAARLGVDSLEDAPPRTKTEATQPRQDAAQPTHGWEIRLKDGDASRRLTFNALARLCREKRLKPGTVLRGPLTGGVWRQARHTPRFCRLFGACHYCEAKLPPKAKTCPACGTDPDRPRDE